MINKIFENKKGQKFKVLEKSLNKNSSGNYKYYIEFLISKNIYEVNANSIKNKCCYDINYEEQEFLSGIYPQNCGDSLKVIEKTNEKIGQAYYYKCKFLNYPYKCKATKYHILEGCVQNLNIPIGNLNTFIGEGIYNSERDKNIYKKWNHLKSRCDKKSNSFNGSNLCEEWKCFQNFAAWYEEQSKWNTNNYKLELDKDILCNIFHLETKIYSPETCLLIPSDLNCFIFDNVKTGVFVKNKQIYETYCGKLYLKSYLTFKEAKLVYAKKKYEIWFEEVNKFNLPNDLKETLLKYDFSWSWIWENMTEEEIREKYYKEQFSLEINKDYINLQKINKLLNLSLSIEDFNKIKNILNESKT